MAEQRRNLAHVCPDAETLAAYLDGRLTDHARAAVTEHLAECEDCYFIFTESSRARLEQPQERGSARAFRAIARAPRWAQAAIVTGGLAAAASLTLVVQPQIAARLFGRSDVAELVAAVGSERHFEPRLTGGFSYAPVTPIPVVRSGDTADDRVPPDVRIAALKLEQRLKSDRSAANLRAYAAAQLVVGRSDRAVSSLEEAARLVPHDSRLQSDLAAAYLVRFKDRNNLEDVTRAVGAAADATEHDPTLREARFNLALALEALSLREEARKAWQAYLAIDSSSPWAAEARQHLDALAPEKQSKRFEVEHQQVVDAAASGDPARALAVAKRLPDTAYDHVENELIPMWADAWLAGDRTKADDALHRARVLGDAIAAAVGERMGADAIDAIDRTIDDGGPAATDLARAHREFRDARQLYRADKIGDAAALFTHARIQLEHSKSPFSQWATLYLAIADYNRTRLLESAHALDVLLEAAERRQHLLLLGRALRMRGLVRQVTGDVGNSLDDYRHALVTFDRISAREDVAGIHSSIADNLQAIGDLQQAGAHQQQALAGFDFLPDARRRGAILHRSGQLALQWGELPAALAVRNELLADALASAQASAAIAAYQDRADVLQRLGRRSSAIADLDSASHLLNAVTDPGLVARHEAELNLVRGELGTDESPSTALAPLNLSLAFFRDHSMDERLARVYLALGRAQRALGRTADAAATFTTGIGVLERQRLRLPTGGLRLSYFEQPWNLFDELIDLESGPIGNPARALAIAERARARDLLESSPIGASDPIDPSALPNVLPPDTAVAYFASLHDRLIVWLLSAGVVKRYEQALPAAALQASVARFVSALQQQDVPEASDDIAARLFDSLIAPWSDRIPAGAILVIVPDGPLHSLPFAALVNRRTGRRLIEEHALATAPSATMFARASARAETRFTARDVRLLVVGNPTIDHEDAAGLADLGGAEAEVHDIVSLFKGASVLTGAHATKTAFLDAAGTHEIVHFAGHAIANDDYPALSRLLLARDVDGRSGSVFATELLDIPFPDTKLVVLAACSTARGPVRKGEGPLGLARPFLARGVPSVVATLWDVDDVASRRFFKAFYAALHDGAGSVEALRMAQTTMLHDRDPKMRAPRAWAGFVNIGA